MDKKSWIDKLIEIGPERFSSMSDREKANLLWPKWFLLLYGSFWEEIGWPAFCLKWILLGLVLSVVAGMFGPDVSEGVGWFLSSAAFALVAAAVALWLMRK